MFLVLVHAFINLLGFRLSDQWKFRALRREIVTGSGRLRPASDAIGHFRILGIGLELASNGGSCRGISLKRDERNLHLKRLPRITLTCKLVQVQYREYENGL